MGASSFNEMEIDAIGEIMNISLGASATAVSAMLGTAVNITTPVVNVFTKEEFEFRSMEPAVGVEIAYTVGLEGNNIMMFRRNDVRVIVGMLMDDEIPEDDFELDEINISAICEVMNQMMGSSATALSEFLGTGVNISTPISFEIENDAMFKDKYFPVDESMVVVRFVLEIEDKLKSEFLNIMPIKLTKRLLVPFQAAFAAEQQIHDEKERQIRLEEELIQSKQAEEARAAAEPVQAQPQLQAAEVRMEPQAAPVQPQPVPQQPIPQQPIPPYQMVPPSYPMPSDPMMLQLLNQMQQTQSQMMELMKDVKGKEKERDKRSRESSVIRPVDSVQMDGGVIAGQEEQANQEMLMKVPLEVSVEIGRTKKPVRDILEFTQGSLVVLDKMAGEQADLFVNGQCIARGDIVVVEDNFGIRITEIIPRDLNAESL